MAKGIHIAHLNIRSLVNKWEVFKTQLMSGDLHVVTLSETWLNDKIPNSILDLSKDYTFIRNDRQWSEEGHNEPKKGGAVAMYIKNTLNYSATDYNHWNTSNRNIESQWVKITLPNSKPIIIGNIYRPPQGSIENFVQVLDDVFSQIDLSKFEIYLLGDMNIDMSDKKSEAYTKIMNAIKPQGLCQLIRHPTRYSNTKNSILDLCITNSDFIKRSGVCDINLSDHQMILITRKKAKITKSKCSFVGRSYRNYVKNNFQDSIIDADWTNYNNERTVSGKWSQFVKIVRNIIDVTCPLKSFNIKQVKEPWITPPLIELIKDKDMAIKQAKKGNDPVLWRNAKQLRNTCTNRLRKARADYIKENLENNIGNSKKFWKNIQDVLPSKKGKAKGNFDLHDENDKNIASERVADFINNFFVNIGPNLARGNDTEWEFNGNQSEVLLDDIKTNREEIIKICKDININKSSCIDHLSSEILRDAFLAKPDILLEIFNLSFEQSDVPDE